MRVFSTLMPRSNENKDRTGVEEKWLKTTYGSSQLEQNSNPRFDRGFGAFRNYWRDSFDFFSKAFYLDSVIEKDTVHGFSDHIHTTK